VIFRQGFTVRGLTTAASLWLVAAVGMAAGAGFWSAAVIGTAVALLSLRPLDWAKNRMVPRRAGHVLSIELEEGASAGSVLEGLEQLARVDALRRDGGHLEAEISVHRLGRAELLAEVGDLPGVREVRWS
jgi:putative Mg2+ transporter-C (MgtC) family protein